MISSCATTPGISEIYHLSVLHGYRIVICLGQQVDLTFWEEQSRLRPEAYMRGIGLPC